MLATDVIYNSAMLVIDAIAIAVAARSSHGRSFLVLLPAAVAAGLLAWTLSGGFFELARLVAFAIFGHVPLVLMVRAWSLRRESSRGALAYGLAGTTILAVAVHAFLIEPYWLEVRRLRLEAPGLTAPVRIAVVADLQAERIGAYERGALRRVVEAAPDLVLMPGDYIHVADPTKYRRLASELREAMALAAFEAPLGVFAVRGNTDRRGWPDIFRGTSVRTLSRTQSFSVGELVVTGLDLRDSFDRSLHLSGKDGFHIVFGHGPDYALGRIEADLLVAGHTHGGQVRIPFLGPLVTFSRVPRSWADGVTRLPGGRTLVVSRGIGMERGAAPRLRFWCRPEIVIIDLVPAESRVALKEE